MILSDLPNLRFWLERITWHIGNGCDYRANDACGEMPEMGYDWVGAGLKYLRKLWMEHVLNIEQIKAPVMQW